VGNLPTHPTQQSSNVDEDFSFHIQRFRFHLSKRPNALFIHSPFK
jgi:hypothetical protein